MAFSVHFEGVREAQAAISRLVARADVAGRTIVTKGGHIIEAAAKQHMDGRPGPNRITGTLSRSVRLLDVSRRALGGWESHTGPTVVYARRIELGFDGADSLGRVYHQPPYPYLAPGFDDAKPRLRALATTEWAKALR